MAATDVDFNANDINDGVIYVTSDIDDSAPWERKLSIFNLARRNGAVISNSEYLTKSIIHTGKVHGTSIANLEANMDALNRILSAQDANLDIFYAGATRRYKCTAASVKFERPVRAAAWANFEIEYTVTDYATDLAATSLFSGNLTTTDDVALNVGGSAPEQFIRVQITLTTVVVGVANTIYMRNPDTGQVMSVTRTWVQGDVLIVDSYDESVTVNGEDTEYTGAFLIYPPGSGQIMVIDADFNETTHTDTITASGNWTAPALKYSATVKAWGAGASGQGFAATIAGGSGGAGGSFASSVVAVVPGTLYPVVIGAGGVGVASLPVAGGDTKFNTDQIIAKGGPAGTLSALPASASVGDVRFAAGNGGIGTVGGGGGGEGASDVEIGHDGAAWISGGAGGTGGNGGDGGAGNAAQGNGSPGSAAGGGGGGARRITSGSRLGGDGARGEVKVLYPVPAYTFAVVVDHIRKYL